MASYIVVLLRRGSAHLPLPTVLFNEKYGLSLLQDECSGYAAVYRQTRGRRHQAGSTRAIYRLLLERRCGPSEGPCREDPGQNGRSFVFLKQSRLHSQNHDMHISNHALCPAHLTT